LYITGCSVFLNPELAENFSNEDRKNLRSGKEKFVDFVKAKTWAAAAKSKLSNLKHKLSKSTKRLPAKLFSAITSANFQRSHGLMVKPSQIEKYAGVVKSLSLPQYYLVKPSAQVIVPVRPDFQQVRFEVEYKCRPGCVPHQPTAWPSPANLGASAPPSPQGAIFPA
jgi:hypothetical protein